MFENEISPTWHLTVNRICDNYLASTAKTGGFSNEMVKRVSPEKCKQHMLFSYAWVECLSPKHKPSSSTFDILFCWWCATNTLYLTVPAGWEGWGLHQPPRVQNRPSHRVQTEIVSVPHTPPKLVIKHICSHPHNAIHEKDSLICLLLSWLTAVPSKPVIPKSRASSLPQIVSRKWTGEQVGECLWLNADKSQDAGGDVTCASMIILIV